jgi:hypothetical protein
VKSAPSREFSFHFVGEIEDIQIGHVILDVNVVLPESFDILAPACDLEQSGSRAAPEKERDDNEDARKSGTAGSKGPGVKRIHAGQSLGIFGKLRDETPGDYAAIDATEDPANQTPRAVLRSEISALVDEAERRLNVRMEHV